MNTTILIQLIAAHLTGDFLLQSDKMCAEKFSKDSSAKNMALTVHALIQAALAYVFVAQWNCWIIPVMIGVGHFIIDWAKTASRKKDLINFLWDQLVHFCVIICAHRHIRQFHDCHTDWFRHQLAHRYVF